MRFRSQYRNTALTAPAFQIALKTQFGYLKNLSDAAITSHDGQTQKFISSEDSYSTVMDQYLLQKLATCLKGNYSNVIREAVCGINPRKGQNMGPHPVISIL